MRLLSLFSGIGAFEKALTNIGVNYKVVGFSEIDKYAAQSYCAIHSVDEDLNLGDIRNIKIENLPSDVDLVTYGFPCQDISIAGKQKGINKDTRSGLLYEAERIIEYTKPKYAIAENVKNLIGKRHKEDFGLLLGRLNSYGYNNYWGVLNAENYGVPQNRERVFIISIRKDVDDGSFKFPEPSKISLSTFDLLSEEVEDKYYISTTNLKRLKENHDNFPEESCIIGGMQKNQSIKTDGVCTTLTSSMGMGGGYIPMIKLDDDILPTSKKRNEVHNIRKLTPLECWRLMGFEDEDYWKARKRLEEVFYNGNDRSNSQMYKQAGNSIVVTVLERVFEEMFK